MNALQYHKAFLVHSLTSLFAGLLVFKIVAFKNYEQYFSHLQNKVII